MRVSVVTFPVLRSRTVIVVILRSSCTVTDLSLDNDCVQPTYLFTTVVEGFHGFLLC